MDVDEEEAAYGGVFAFDFYEVVRVTASDVLPRGTLVTVLARSRDDNGTEWYAVTESDGEGPVLPGTSLAPTGRRLRREDFYDGTSVKVTPHGQLADER